MFVYLFCILHCEFDTNVYLNRRPAGLVLVMSVVDIKEFEINKCIQRL